jgi:hypothetical protein
MEGRSVTVGLTVALVLASVTFVAVFVLAIALAMIAADADRQIEGMRERACRRGEGRRVEP